MISLIPKQNRSLIKIRWFLLMASLALLPLVLQMPNSFSWENGPLEMAQNAVLLINMCICLYFFASTKDKNIHYLWLNSAALYLILLGRELNWGRVFFLKKMLSHGPVFYSMEKLTNALLVHSLIGLFVVVVLFLFWKLTPWKWVRSELSNHKSVIIVLIILSVLSIVGDMGYLFHSYLDEALEEYAELLLYVLLGHVTIWFYNAFKYF